MIGRWGSVALIVIVLVGWVSTGQPTGVAEAAAPAAAPEADAAQQIRSAQRTQRTTRGTLRVLSGGTRCADARFVAYRRSDREPDVVDQWYVVSQLWADAALLAADADNPKLRAQASLGEPAGPGPAVGRGRGALPPGQGLRVPGPPLG